MLSQMWQKISVIYLIAHHTCSLCVCMFNVEYNLNYYGHTNDDVTNMSGLLHDAQAKENSNWWRCYEASDYFHQLSISWSMWKSFIHYLLGFNFISVYFIYKYSSEAYLRWKIIKINRFASSFEIIHFNISKNRLLLM